MQQIRSKDCRRRRRTLSAALCMSSSNIKAQEVAGSDVIGWGPCDLSNKKRHSERRPMICRHVFRNGLVHFIVPSSS
ncbi:hypothetical protein QQF64_008981 [Cirrhinus molitorella]|uniref:Secreted protein n=1 Tax=Cirrhinus molitorella TaxID=172907 RepID=A0ABR3M7S7_9TELE